MNDYADQRKALGLCRDCPSALTDQEAAQGRTRCFACRLIHAEKQKRRRVSTRPAPQTPQSDAP